MHKKIFKKLLPYSYALIVTSSVLLIRLKILTYAPTQHPSMLLAVVLSAWLGGMGPGIMSSLLASTLYLYYFIPPDDSFTILSAQDAIQLTAFSLTAIIIGSLTGALNSARKNAIELGKRRAQFLANLSHEVRTPLTSIMGLSNMLLEDPPAETRTKLIEAVKEASHALSALIEDLFDVSKIDYNSIKLNQSEFSLSKNLSNALETFAPRLQAKNIEINLIFDFEIPEKIIGDWIRVRQVLMILLDNAIKFSKPDTEVRVSFKLNQKNDSHCAIAIAVEDQGVGIPNHLTRKIFEPFFQVDAHSTRRQGGTGLGLAICKRLVEVMGGEIEVKSKIGLGSTFSFVLPFQIAAEKNIPLEESDLNSMHHLLVIEDHAICRIVISNQLKKLGYHADVVSTAEEAYCLVEKNSYSGILMDCHMPEIDGYEASQHIRNLQEKGLVKNIPIIAMSADASLNSLNTRLQSGMVDLLQKPILQEKLKIVLDRWIGKNSKEEEIPLLLRLEHQIGKENLIDLVEIFLKNTPQRLEVLEKVLADQNRQQLKQQVHLLRSACSTVGAEKMAKICQDIEEKCDKTSFDEIKIWVTQLIEEFPKAADELNFQLSSIRSQSHEQVL